jgi:hypothetical protein
MVITFSNAPTLRIPLSVTGAPWTLVDDASSAITYSGFLTVTGIDPGLWYQGTAHSATNAGASASYTCTACTRVDWLATTGPDRGTATVSVDGKYVTTIDSFASTLTASHVLYSAAGLALGAHTITVTATGAPRSTGSWIEIDEFRSA